MKYNFPVIYWSNQSTKVQFEPFTKLPSDSLVSSCFVFVKKGSSVLLARPERGWGLPGGHKEPQESPEDCAIREVLEEASIEIKNLRLLGGWKAQKVKQVEQNSKYPEVAYQLLFLADVAKIHKFTPDFETLERKFVEYSEIEKYHQQYDQFSAILAYILDYTDEEHS